jgi:hypothetical protein
MTDTDTRSSGPPDVAASVREAGAAAREQITGTARSALEDARTAAADKTTELKDVAVGEIDRTARGLEAAAAELEASPLQHDLLHEAAEGLKQISRAMQGKSIGTMVEELSDFGRRNPLAYLGGAALAGFALARFARASASEATADDRSREPDQPRWNPDVRTAPAEEDAGQRPVTEVPGGFTHG